MEGWSSSLFLQALGWSTLNSFWQMALLWCLLLLSNHYVKLSSHTRYLLALYSLISGFIWFLFTFINYYNNAGTENFLLPSYLTGQSQVMPVVLTAASLAYLLLFMIPAYKVFKSWRFIQKIKKTGIQKAPCNYRLFIQKIGTHLGIRRKVFLYASEIITSPITVGYLKPIILLPIASLNQLTVHQTEAILLHELSHIRRCDYLINLLMTLIHLVLYFNPFVRLFIKKADFERENCCDEMVLQFQYDKLSYASALLQLEKFAHASAPLLTICAVQKSHLLTRIEKIMGIHKKQSFNKVRFAGLLVVLLLLFMVNTLVISSKKEKGELLSGDNFSSPFALFSAISNEAPQNTNAEAENRTQNHIAEERTKKNLAESIQTETGYLPHLYTPFVEEPPTSEFVPVAFDEIDASLNKEEKEQVKNVVAGTKKVLQTVEWKEVEKSIGDGMTQEEKEIAKAEYLHELEKLDWKGIEQKLKTEYNAINWEKVNANLNNALTLARLDSVQKVYTSILAKLNASKCSADTTVASPLPDASVIEIQKMKEEVLSKLEMIKKIREKKIISL